MQKIKKFLSTAKKAFTSWNEHDPFRQSAVVAYYAVFSLPALLVVITTVAGLIFGVDAVVDKVSNQIGDTMGADTGDQVKSMIAKAGETKDSIIATIIGVITIIFGATGVFAELQTSLNIIWGVKVVVKKKFLKMVKDRLFSFGLVLSIAFMLLVSFVLSSVMAVVSDQVQALFSDGLAFVFIFLDFIISVAVISTLFALMFKILPDVKIGWREVIPGSILTAILFAIGKIALTFYFGKAEPDATYGAAGSVILILLWVSYSGMIFFYGAEFTKQNLLANNKKVQPGNGAANIPIDCAI